MARPRETLRFLAAIALGTCATLGLAGCDPYAVPREPDKAEIEINVHADERVEMKLFLPPRFEHADLLGVGHDAGEALFGGGPGVSERINENDGGFAFPVITAAHSYRSGGRPTVTLDTAGLQRVLRSHGLPKVSLSVCGPHVPISIVAVPPSDHRAGPGCAYWASVAESEPPHVRLSLRPQPWRWFAEISAIGLAAVAAALAFRSAGLRRARGGKRTAGVTLAMASLVLCTAAIFTGAGAQGDNLGVAGFLSGWRLTVATFAPLLVLPLTIVALVALFTTLRRSPTSVS